MGLTERFTAQQLFFGSIFIPLLVGALIGGIFLGSSAKAEEQHVLGGKNAKVKLVEYSDFQCPFCQKMSLTIKQLVSEYGDKISVEYRHYPLSFHPMATPAAMASECAAEQGKFWEFHDAVFANQSALSVEMLRGTAQSLRLNMKKFNTCFDSGKYALKVQQQQTEGAAKGVQGTPATFVNGQFVSGAQPFEAFKQIIDSQL